jgi:hypothetical protein
MINSEMYKIQYMAGQGKLEIISVLEKKGQDWVLVKDPILENTLASKLLHKDHYNKHNSTLGYGQIVVNEKLAYITGSFEIPKK